MQRVLHRNWNEHVTIRLPLQVAYGRLGTGGNEAVPGRPAHFRFRTSARGLDSPGPPF